MRRGALALFWMVWVSTALAGPQLLTYQGKLTDGNGIPVAGTYSMQFQFYDQVTQGVVRWTEVNTSVTVTAGSFAVILGDESPFGLLFHAYANLWLQLAIDLNKDGQFLGNEIYAPRERLTGTPFAFDASYLQGIPASGFAAPEHTHQGSDIITPVTTTTVASSALALQGYPISNAAPSTNQGLQWSGTAWVPASDTNQPPHAILQANPSIISMIGDRPVTTTLSLNLSYDPEPGTRQYAFDPTGQGTAPQYGASPTTPVAYSRPGSHMAFGWVRDASGKDSVARTIVSVYAWWQVTPDAAGDVGQHASLAIISGHPAIAYYDVSNIRLKYARANDPDGLSWNPGISIYAGGAVFGSLAEVEGRPAIAFQSTGLRYMRANDSTGSSWGGSLLLDSDIQAGQHASMAIVQGRPAIAYFDMTNTRLRYVRANDSTGSSWGSSVVVDGSGNAGWWASLAVINGRPAIAYRDGTSGHLRYVRAADSTGSSWGSPVSADTAGVYASLADVNGRPAIAYLGGNTSVGDLKYVRANDADGAIWGSPISIDAIPARNGTYASLATIWGRPAVASYDEGGSTLRFVFANDLDGDTWGPPQIAARGLGTVPARASLRSVNNRPGIAYYNRATGDLCFTLLFER